MKAVIVTGGKQYTVAEGDVVFVEKLGADADATVKFDQVLAVLDGENTSVSLCLTVLLCGKKSGPDKKKSLTALF